MVIKCLSNIIAQTLKNISTNGGLNLKPSLTPGLRFKNDPVAIRRDTHSMGIILHFLLMNALSAESSFETNAVSMPKIHHRINV